MNSNWILAKCLWSRLAAVLALSTAGCAINSEYPASWPRQTSGDALSQLEGAFQCRGHIVNSNTGGSKTAISDFLIKKDLPDCEYIEIARPQPNELEIRFMRSGQEFLRQRYEQDRDYQLQDNWVVLKSFGSLAAEDIVIAHTAVRPYLTINATRDLVIKAENSTIGTIALVPVGTSGTDWGRFKPCVPFESLGQTGVAGQEDVCPNGPTTSPDSDAYAKAFPVATEKKSRIYLYRNEIYGSRVPMTVTLDGKVSGQTSALTYFMWEVDPGIHEIASHAENVDTLKLNTEVGKTYFVWQEVKTGFWKARSVLRQVDDVVGQKGVSECKRVQSKF